MIIPDFSLKTEFFKPLASSLLLNHTECSFGYNTSSKFITGLTKALGGVVRAIAAAVIRKMLIIDSSLDNLLTITNWIYLLLSSCIWKSCLLSLGRLLSLGCLHSLCRSCPFLGGCPSWVVAGRVVSVARVVAGRVVRVARVVEWIRLDVLLVVVGAVVGATVGSSPPSQGAARS